MNKLPVIVREAYDIPESAEVTTLCGGLVNQTFLVEDDSSKTVLQKIAPTVSDSMVNKTARASAHLAARGWEVPEVIPTLAHTPFALDESGNRWRQSTFIASDGKTPSVINNTLLTEAAGRMLGRWHSDMRGFTANDHTPHFHDAAYHTKKMDAYLSFLPDQASQALGRQLLDTRKRSEQPRAETITTIHADPKLDNMLYRDGIPFTLIDFDDIMTAPRWIDCGDFLRSLSGKLIDTPDLDVHFKAFVSSYHEAADVTEGLEQAYDNIRQATGQVALTLSMRYLCDIIDNNYFSWSDELYNSRRDNHFAKAELMLRVAQYALTEER